MADTEPSARTAREIASHLSSARQAFVARDYQATLLACEKVLLLDPHNGEALDLFDLARTTAAEERIEGWLNQARQSLDRGDIGKASDLIDQALALDPHLEPALALRKRMLAIRRDRGRERARLNEQDFESAVWHADEAVSLDPQSTEAQEIPATAPAALDSGRPQASRPARAGARRALGAPGSWSLRRGLPIAAAGLILLVAIWFGIYQLGLRSTPPAQSSAPPPPEGSARGEIPAAVSPDAPTDEELRDRKLAGLRQDARDQFQRGQRTALDTVAAGLKIAPEDSELRALLDSILADAQRITGRAKEAAASAGAEKYTKTYHEALKLERAAGQQVTAGRKDEAIRVLWKAEESFDRAERDARFEVAQLKQQQLKLGAIVESKSAAAESPPVPAASTPPPDPQPSVADLEKARVAGIVYRYANGYSALNAAAVSAVYPGEATWLFSEFDSYLLKVEDLAIELSPDGTSATVACTATHTFKRKSAAAPITERLRQIFSLRKRGAGWIIASIRYDRGR